jgi:hypothetical protein
MSGVLDSGPKKAVSDDVSWIPFDPLPEPSNPAQRPLDVSSEADATSPAPPADASTQSPSGDPEETPPTGEPCSGAKLERGCPCWSGTECATGACVEGSEGTICAGSCFDSCPEGWHCGSVGAAGPDAASLCIPRSPRLCRPCGEDADCRVEGGDRDVRCLSFAHLGSFCGASCVQGGRGCPEGYVCDLGASASDPAGYGQCVPEDGLCSCLPGMEGAVTTCLAEVELGFCPGSRRCSEGELSPCVPEGASGACAGLCTEEVCSERRGCTTTIVDGFCLIEEGCYPAGAAKPGSPCETCDPARSAIAWSLVGQGAPCDDGDPCTVGDACHASICAGGSYSCDDGIACTADSCDGDGGCEHEVSESVCLVDGACVAATTPHPEDPCRACRPEIDDEGWSEAGDTRCDDGIACTEDRCDGAGGCIHTSVCDDGNPCTDDTCDSRAGCTNSPTAAPCDDGDPCTSADRCSAGSCTGQAMDCPPGETCTNGQCFAPWSREQVVDARPSLGARLPKVVPDIAGGFTVFWLQTTTNSETGQPERRVEAAGFDTGAARVRGPQPIGPVAGEEMIWARGAAANATGSYHVTWAAPGDDGLDAILAEISHDLAVAGSESVPMLHGATGNQSEPVVAAITGGYVVSANTDYFDVWGNVMCVCKGPSHYTTKACQRPHEKRALRFRGVAHDSATQVEQINGCTPTSINARHDQLHLMAGTTSQAVLAFRHTDPEGRTMIRVDRFNPLGVHLDSSDSELTIPPSSDPAVAKAPSGELLVVWAEGEGDGSDVGIVARSYAEGKGFSESERFVVNTHTLGAQEQPAVASVGNGAVVVWTSWWQDGSGGGIYAQRFQLAGDGRWMPRGAEEQVNVEGGGHQSWPSVAAVGPDRFAVVWEHLEGDASLALRGRVLPW